MKLDKFEPSTPEIVKAMVDVAKIKGRDYYNLIWFLEKGVIPNRQYIRQLTGITKKDSIDIIHFCLFLFPIEKQTRFQTSLSTISFMK